MLLAGARWPCGTVSLVVMLLLSWAQRRTGRALGSNAVVADSTQTVLCTYLSAALLVGLVLADTLEVVGGPRDAADARTSSASVVMAATSDDVRQARPSSTAAGAGRCR